MIPLIQCVPNFSEGRDPVVIAAIVKAVRQTPGVRLADWSADPDHNRLVVTFIGQPDPIRTAALAAADAAMMNINIGIHQGVHPRLGALDVLPFVPLSNVTLAECAALAREVAQELSARYELPIFLYEAASPDARSLPFVRKNAFRALLPDFGPHFPHPTAGATVVGARGPLIAYNVLLTTPDITFARAIAHEIRSLPHLPGIRALGLRLPSRELTQVSMNLTKPEQTPLLSVFEYIKKRAIEMGVVVGESEVIGALPGPTAFEVIGDALHAPGLRPGQILRENWPREDTSPGLRTSPRHKNGDPLLQKGEG